MFKITDEKMGSPLDNNETFNRMKKIYDEIEDIVHHRSVHPKEKAKKLDIKINEVDKIYSEFYAEVLKIMAHLVKGTAFFRKAQVLAGRYGGADICHVEAAQLLEMVYISDRYNLINMLTLLNLGKNLRNMGMHGYRSIYDRALDCFNDIQWRIENELRKSECGKKLTRWESCLWLEAKINIGRIHKYLYKMEEAKEDFWYVLNILLIKGIDRKNDVESTVENDALLRKDKEKKGNSLWMETFLSDYKNEYKKYLLQVLVELGTVYLKERYLGAAKNLFLVTLAIDPKNVDAKNNIAVYLRKRNMPGDNYKAVRILREEEEKGNRFALINVLKCRIAMIGNIEVGNAKEDEGISKLLEDCRAYEKTYYSEDCLESVLREKIMEQPEDLELKLLLGLYYKKKKQWNKALKVFQEIYEKSPNIRKGTIGLKAYYNIVQEYMRKKQFHKAKVELEHIQL